MLFKNSEVRSHTIKWIDRIARLMVVGFIIAMAISAIGIFINIIIILPESKRDELYAEGYKHGFYQAEKCLELSNMLKEVEDSTGKQSIESELKLNCTGRVVPTPTPVSFSKERQGYSPILSHQDLNFRIAGLLTSGAW